LPCLERVISRRKPTKSKAVPPTPEERSVLASSSGALFPSRTPLESQGVVHSQRQDLREADSEQDTTPRHRVRSISVVSPNSVPLISVTLTSVPPTSVSRVLPTSIACGLLEDVIPREAVEALRQAAVTSISAPIARASYSPIQILAEPGYCYIGRFFITGFLITRLQCTCI